MTRFLSLFSLTTLILGISCNQKKPNTYEYDYAQIEPDSARYVQSLDTTSFEYFWHTFRAASNKNEFDNLTSMMKFPVAGEDWEDPDQAKENLPRIFDSKIKNAMTKASIEDVRKYEDQNFEKLGLDEYYVWSVSVRDGEDEFGEIRWTVVLYFAQFGGKFKLYQVLLVG